MWQGTEEWLDPQSYVLWKKKDIIIFLQGLIKS